MKVYATRRIHEGRVLNLRLDEVDALKGGKRWVEVVEHVGGVAIVVQPDPDSIVLVRQHRHAVGEDTWEVPAGMIDPNEDPDDAAHRELIEETGYRAESLRFLFSLYSTPGFCEERIRLYVAQGLTAGESKPDDNEAFEVRTWPIADAWAEVAADRFRDAKTQIALAWARANV